MEKNDGVIILGFMINRNDRGNHIEWLKIDHIKSIVLVGNVNKLSIFCFDSALINSALEWNPSNDFKRLRFIALLAESSINVSIQS